MRIRYQITLWITLAGVFASLILSLVIFFELIEESHELLDQELEANARSLAKNFEFLAEGPSTQISAVKYFTPYWVRITDGKYRVLYESETVEKVDLPLKETTVIYSVPTNIPLNRLFSTLEEDEDELATFRVFIYSFSFSGQEYQLQIARPIENRTHEIIELSGIIGGGLAISALILILISYHVSGRILHPIKKINFIASEFSERTLDKRVPLGEQKDEIYELSSSLNSMFDRLQFSFLRQKEFIANASHELKTPITLLRLSLAELLQEEETSPSQIEKLEKLNETVLRIERLVKSLLSLSSLELSDTLSPEEFVLNELTDSLIEEFHPLVTAQNIQFISDIDDQITVKADREQMKRVFINLFENAIKYNQDDGEIRLQMWSDKQNGTVIIDLFNTGHGVPIEYYERVFEQFYRVEKSRSTALGGVGLGLTITKKIIELHNGTISLNGKLGSWVQFHITLPILMC